MPFPSAQLECRSGANAIRTDLTRGRHQVSMKITRIGAGPRLVSRTVDCAAMLVGQLGRECANQAATLIRCRCLREKYEPFESYAGVTAEAGVLHGVSKCGAVWGPGHVVATCEIGRENDLLVDHVVTVRVVVDLACSFVADALACAIGGGSRGAGPLFLGRCAWRGGSTSPSRVRVHTLLRP